MKIKSGAIYLRLISPIFGLLFCLISLEAAHASPRYGIWVEVEGKNRPFESPENYQTFIDFIAKTNFTDIYCQVYRGGRTWFPSMVADSGPYHEALKKGIDPLRGAIDAAHARGQKIHAWVNVLRLTDNRSAPLLKVVGKRAAAVDSWGNSILDYDENGFPPGPMGEKFMLGTPGIWLDASVPAVRRHIAETVRDLILAYPDLDGVHLDMVRFPMSIRRKGRTSREARPSFGFGEESISRFYSFAGKEVPAARAKVIRELRGSTAWATWQRAQVTLLVFEIRSLLNDIAPHMELSAAVIASAHRSFNEVKQDWSNWLSGGIVDSAVLMSYSRDPLLVKKQTKHAVAVAADRGQALTGLGAWLMLGKPEALTKQGKIALSQGAEGLVLFSYSNLQSPSGELLLKRFSESIFPPTK
jgi:uncharacterized lipoprotein YddW (UPF0748 family)